MLYRSVIIFSVGAIILAMVVPGQLPTEAVNGSASTAAAPTPVEAAPVSAAAAPPSGSTFQIQRGNDSHFRTIAQVNGRPVAMMIDSGATTVVLTASDARAIGLSVPPSGFTATAQTAGGAIRVAPVVIDRIALGNIEQRGVQAAVVEDAKLGQSLLGQSFLGRLNEMTVTGDVMRLR